MKSLRAIVREVWGLFVDDAGFATAILAWLALAWLGSAQLAIASAWNGAILFGGLALILIVSAVRRAQRP